MNPNSPASSPAVDPQNPWLGLASFSEETRAFFHGRDDDAAELARRVQRKLLTVLFGQSGHGKTSLLRAGLVPRLRAEGYCPVYVRLDYSPGSPPPSEQIKAAIFEATRIAGTWTKSGSAGAGESLWEFLHHRDDKLTDAAGRPLIPLLIFDQFEEIFTLAQSDEAGRRRAESFIGELADLVENRPPAELEGRIDREEADAAKYDFARADYRVLISLREDYLAHLETLKGRMPSVTQNRVRLARFTGAQALAAVRTPAPQLVSEDVAQQIVRFIAGDADLAHAEVEPSLLSLVCRELNNARLARGQSEITADLLAGSRDTILSEFYERALTDQPAGVRRFIEDELLTDSGYRESVAEERVKKAFALAGAAPDALPFLIGRRLLRVEERLDVRRVELTHDVLCSVVKATREVRQEREAKEAAEAQLTATRAKEAATRGALRRARLVAGVCTVLLVFAAGAAVLAFSSRQRARQAEQSARHAAEAARAAEKSAQAAEAKTESQHKLAETARGQAEGLASFLLADFFDELEPTGRFDTIARLAERTVNYYSGLPEELRSPATERRRALAMMRHGSAVFSQGKYAAGEELLKNAVEIFERLRAENEGDNSGLGLGLALAYYSQAISPGQIAARKDTRDRAVELLRAAAKAPNSSNRTKRGLAFALRLQAFNEPDEAASLAIYEEAQRVLTEAGALNFTDLAASSAYARVTRDIAVRQAQARREPDAERAREVARNLTRDVLSRRPGDLEALFVQSLLDYDQAETEFRRYDLERGLALAAASERTLAEYLRFNPSNAAAWQGMTAARVRAGAYLAQQGRIGEAIEKLRAATNILKEQRSEAEAIGFVPAAFLTLARWEAQRGNHEAAEQALAEGRRARALLDRDARSEQGARNHQLLTYRPAERELKFTRGDYAGVIASAEEDVIATQKFLETAEGLTRAQHETLERHVPALRQIAANAHALLGNFAEAEAIFREFLRQHEAQEATKPGAPSVLTPSRRIGFAYVLARQGQREEALQIVTPAIASYRERRQKGDVSIDNFTALGWSLYVHALAQPEGAEGEAARRASLADAAQIMGGLSAEAQALYESRQLIERIAEERAKLPGGGI